MVRNDFFHIFLIALIMFLQPVKIFLGTLQLFFRFGDIAAGEILPLPENLPGKFLHFLPDGRAFLLVGSLPVFFTERVELFHFLRTVFEEQFLHDFPEFFFLAFARQLVDPGPLRIGQLGKKCFGRTAEIPDRSRMGTMRGPGRRRLGVSRQYHRDQQNRANHHVSNG